MSAILPPLTYQQLAFTAWGDPLPLITGTQSNTRGFYVALSGTDMLLFSFLYFDPGFACIRIRQDGTSCIYLSTNYKLNFDSQAPVIENFSAQQISSTNFVLNNGNGGIYYFVLPSFFAPGATFVVPEVDFAPPSPCGVGALQNSFYDAVNNLSAYEFVQPFPDASNIYASIYKGAYGGAQPVTAGFIGNFPNGSDGFDRTSLALPPYVNNYSGMTDGAYAYTRGGILYANIGYVALPYQALGFSGIRINNGASLACGGNGSTESYVETIGAYTAYLNNYDLLQSGMPNFLTNQPIANCGVVDSPNAAMVCGDSCVWAFSPQQIILFFTGGLERINAAWLLGNYLVIAISNPSGADPAALSLYRAPIETFTPYIGPLPPRPLYNYARGVPIHADAPRFSGFRKSRIIL